MIIVAEYTMLTRPGLPLDYVGLYVSAIAISHPKRIANVGLYQVHINLDVSFERRAGITTMHYHPWVNG